MLCSALVAGAAIAVGLYALWTRLVFQVKVLWSKRQYIAGEYEQHICTIEVSLPDNYYAENLNEPFPKPDSYKFIRTDDSCLEFDCGAVTECFTSDTRELVIDIYALLKTVGTYQLTPVFRNENKVNFIGIKTIQFEVLPSRLCSLTPLKVKRQDTGFCVERKDILYNGGTAKLFVQVSDRFGNVVKDELTAEIDSEYVSVSSCEFVNDDHCHIVSVHCRKDGETTLDLRLGNGIQGKVDVTIVPAPIAPDKCRLYREEKGGVVAGEKVRWKLKLKNIYGNAATFRENFQDQHGFSVDSVDILPTERRSINVSQNGSDSFNLELTPTLAGERSFTFYLNSSRLGYDSEHVYVSSAGLKSISMVTDQAISSQTNSTNIRGRLRQRSIKENPGIPRKNIPKDESCGVRPRSALQTSSSSIFTSEMQSMSFRGNDRYGNPVLLNQKEWCLNVCKSSEQPDEKDESVMIIVSKRASDDSTLCFSFYFETKGVYKVNIMQKGKCVETQVKDDVTFPKSVVFKARQAPLDPKKCRIASISKSKVTAGRKIKMTVELYDRYGKPYILDECKESMDKFCVKLNDVQNRKDSLKLLSSRSHVCKVEWNPTLAGLHKYVVYFDDKQLGEETFEIHVNPRPLKSVKVVQSYSLLEETVAAPPHGAKIPEFYSKEFGVFENTSYIDRSFYTNEKQFISFQGKDKYGNLVVLNPEEWCLNVRKDDTNLDVNNAFQETKSEDSTLCFSYCFNAKGTYSVSLKRRDTTGNSKDGEDLPKPLVFNVLPAPLDHSKCRITSSHNLDTIAGEKVHLNVELFDIFEKPFMLEELEESIHKFSLKIIGVENGEESLRLLSSGGHGCELEWTPTLAGRHIFQIYFDGRVLGKESVTIAVNPGSLRSILVLETQSSFVEGTNKFLCLTNEKKTLFLKGCDEFENDVSVDSEQWYLRAESEDGISVNLDQEKTLDGPILKFFFRFNTEGTYNVHMQHIDGDNADIAIPKGFKVIVDTAPLDPEKCSSQHMDAEKPIFAQPSVPLKFKIELFDCMSNPFDSSKVKKEAFDVKVNGEAIAHFLEPCESSNTVLIVVNVDTRDKDFVDFTTEYQQITVAKPITIKVTGVSPYEELDYINVSPESMLINIFNVSHRQLIGEDFANIDNINRALTLWHIRCSDFVVMRDPVDGNFAQLYYEEIVDETQFYWNDEKTKSELTTTSKLLSLLAESIHYRTRAYEMDHEREEWKGKSEDAYKNRKHEEAKECSEIKEKYSRLMDDAHDKASQAILAFFNYNRTEKEIDLHGQLVADEHKLKKYENQLRRKFNSSEVKKKVQQVRSKRDEAINHLEKRLASQEEHQLDWLDIIVVAGRHSNDNRQKIRPNVETFLDNNNLGFTECNKGSLLITYKEYKGKQPCYASFYCKKCDKSWESRSSWKDYWQMCFKCDKKGVESKCYPLKLRSASGSQKRTNRSGISSGPTFTREDHKRLCQKCQELPDDVYCDD